MTITKHEALIATLGDLTIAELAALVTRLESEWGVDRRLPVYRPPPPPPPEPTAFDVVLHGVSGRRIDVIRTLRTMRPDLDLRGARDLLRDVPAVVVGDVDLDGANERRSALAEAGADVEVQPRVEP